MTPPSRVLLLTRDGCHLCVEAEAVIRRTCEDMGVGWRVIDVDTHEHLRARFTDHVPVTFVDQELHGYWFVDETTLRAALATSAPQFISADWTP
ncbi:glutaredoxin family protein [Tessaracoccus sp. MC1865]|uniref:glutaredoxin family protein n=1 Tax=unclassified Tessaracoccus TaxID=2635419 RepID=UPI001600DF79|nr:glutaredoxin family protein [Tessaracoccus sp. MC1865]MBB1483993.1 glutaredoxin family protein [Tessaracoccus sp. MC1865]MBB1508500.1 glutaredoxin family protein [Tessaracoccus sp. MC1756]QTO37037.1 glutaredoxin family protein [Tessaracoccus sp. MC1865]